MTVKTSMKARKPTRTRREVKKRRLEQEDDKQEIEGSKPN